MHHKAEAAKTVRIRRSGCIGSDNKALNSKYVNIQLMNRHQAATLLKELIEHTLIQPSLVSLEQRGGGNFELILKTDSDSGAIRKFAEDSNFAFKIDTQKGYCIIYKAHP